MTRPKDPRSEPISATVAKYASSGVYQRMLGIATAYLRPLLLRPDLYGVWTLLGVIPKYGEYAHLGTQSALRYQLPLFSARGDIQRVEAMRSSVFTVALSINGAIAAVLIALALRPSFGTHLRLGLATMAAYIMMQCFHDYLITLLKAEERFDVIIAAQYLRTTLLVGSTIVLLWLWRLEGLYLSLILTHATVLAYLLMRHPIRIRLRLDVPVFLDLLRQGLPIMLTGFGVELITTSDRLIIAACLDKTALGHYGIAVTAFGFLMQIPGTARDVVEPRLMRNLEHLPPAELLNEYFLRPLTNTAFLLPFLIGGVYLALPVVIPPLLPNYVPAIAPTQALVVGIYFMALALAPQMYLVAMNLQALSAILLPPVLAANILISVALVRRYGLLGVAVGSGCSFFLLFVTLFLLVALRAPVRAPEFRRHAMALFVPFAAMVAALFLLGRLQVLLGQGWPAAALAMALYAAAMLGMHRIARARLSLLDALPGLRR